MDYRDNRQRWAESHQVVHFYAGQWCTFTPALTTVRRSSNNTRCTAFGFAKYRSEIDFRYEDVPHHLGFDLRLAEDKFDRILQLMRPNTLDRFYFRVGKVDEFYSDWSPEITTNSIHILPNSCLEELSLDESDPISLDTELA